MNTDLCFSNESSYAAAAEKETFGAILADPEYVLPIIRPLCSPSDFMDSDARQAYDSGLQLLDAGQLTDAFMEYVTKASAGEITTFLKTGFHSLESTASQNTKTTGVEVKRKNATCCKKHFFPF